MTKPLFCIWDNQSIESKKNNRQLAIQNLDLITDRIIPIFDEATQTAANCLGIPVCCLGILIKEEYHLKSASGLSHLGLMNELAITRKINAENSFATHIIDSGNYLIIENTLTDPFFSKNIFSQYYGVISYLGVPLFISNGLCIGCLEVIDTKFRQFSIAEINFLMITARWCMAEYERNELIKKNTINTVQKHNHNNIKNNSANTSDDKKINSQKDSLLNSEEYIRQLSFQLLNKLAQKLSIPLTSVIGMSSVLKQEIYGKLNPKQLEYLQIIHNSGQEMITLVDEITKLFHLKTEVNLNFTPVDLEDLGKQVLKSLETVASSREHTLRLSIEPGEKVWNLDREKVKKTLYYLLITIIEGSRAGGEIQIHISGRSQNVPLASQMLKINCWVSHPWLGDGISFEKINSYQEALKLNKEVTNAVKALEMSSLDVAEQNNYDYDLISLLFSAYLANLQKGNISLLGSAESVYRFVVSIPVSVAKN